MSQPNNGLPPGVNGIDFGEFVLAFANSKVVMSRRGAREHFTLHFGPKSGVVDFHKTSIDDDGFVAHGTIYSIRHGNLGALLEELALPAMKALMSVVRPLDLDMLVEKKITAIVGLLTAPAEIDAITTVRHRKLIVDPDKLAKHAWMPEFLEELYDLKDGQFFTLLSARRRRSPRIVGHGFAITDGQRHRQLLWLPIRRIDAEMGRIGELMRDAAARHGTFHADVAQSA